jgi:hypothetical protein
MEFCIKAKELRNALKEIEIAENNGFHYCLAVFTMISVGRSLDENLAEYHDIVEKAHPTDDTLDWGCGQGVTKTHKFRKAGLIPLFDEDE